MFPEEQNPHPSVHHQTIRGARNALAHRLVSPESYRAVLRGEISLQRARELGRSGAPTDRTQATSIQDEGTEQASGAQERSAEDTPPAPVSRISKSDRSRPCMACGEMTSGSLFHQGCDMKMHRLAREYVRGERDLTDEQLEYVRESGKLERAKARVEKEREKEQRKAERAAARESRKAKK
jgi:hypothetical protein